MKILFAGTPDFAVPSLRRVASGFEIVGVLTSPDKPQGRGKQLVYSPVKEAALTLGLNILQPALLDETFIDTVKKLKPDILAVAAFGKIFKENFLSVFPKGGINLHPSLLPRYRGPAPIPAMIIAGDKEGGITIQKLALKMDSGDILLQKTIELKGIETTDSLTALCSDYGADMMFETLVSLEKDNIRSVSQNESDATYCKLINKENGLINWKDDAELIERKIRAYYSWPKTHTFFKQMLLFISKGIVIKRENDYARYLPGEVLGIDKEHGIIVNTGKGLLGILRLQIQTKREMDFDAFANGYKDIIGSRLGVNNVG